jgi:hypothetical protein
MSVEIRDIDRQIWEDELAVAYKLTPANWSFY